MNRREAKGDLAMKAFTVIMTACNVCPLEGVDGSWIEALGALFNRTLRAVVGARAEDELRTIELSCATQPGEVASRAVGQKACAIVVSQDCDGEFLRQIHESPVQQASSVPILRLRLVPCTDGIGGEGQTLICEQLGGFDEESAPLWADPDSRDPAEADTEKAHRAALDAHPSRKGHGMDRRAGP